MTVVLLRNWISHLFKTIMISVRRAASLAPATRHASSLRQPDLSVNHLACDIIGKRKKVQYYLAEALDSN